MSWVLAAAMALRLALAEGSCAEHLPGRPSLGTLLHGTQAYTCYVPHDQDCTALGGRAEGGACAVTRDWTAL